jgi:hypothetical protein
MKHTIDDNWREEMISFTTDEEHIRLLREGPHSHHEARLLGALRYRYKQIMGIKDAPAPDCSSSFREWNQSVGDK